jgi:hypothetical protein
MTSTTEGSRVLEFDIQPMCDKQGLATYSPSDEIRVLAFELQIN